MILGGMSVSTSSLTRRRMQSARQLRQAAWAACRAGCGPGSTKAKMLTRSSARFSIGVPVMAQLRSRLMPRTTCGGLRVAVLDALGLVEHDHVEVHALVGDERRRRGSAARS